MDKEKTIVMSKSDNEKDGIFNSLEKIGDNIKESTERTGQQISSGFNTGVKKTVSFFKKLLVIALILGILTLIGFFLYANYTYSEGTRAGTLIKISKRGMVFKTYEGQLKLGGIDLSNAEEGLSDTWSFSVTDKEIVKILEKLQGREVILKYKEINRSMPWQGETHYFIKSVEKAD